MASIQQKIKKKTKQPRW